MRDPVDRMISQYKMHCRLTGKELNFCDKYFIDFVNSKKVTERGDYKSTVQNLDKVFNENQVFYGFYEEMFSSEFIDKLCLFLDIPFIDADYKTRINDFKVNHSSDNIDYEYLRGLNSGLYEFCNDRFKTRDLGIFPY